MDFFAQQDRARRNTRFLLVLFSVTVLALIVLVNALLTWFLWLGSDYNVYVGGTGWRGYLSHFSGERFLYIGMAVAATVGFVSLIRWLQLAAGGKKVAESMGGQRVMAQSTDFYEKRCLNVVEELALAASMPVPALYVLPQERGINAFAAGITPADAVVAVTRGTMLQLNREELQGVVGHEYSHILNGDMRLGTRLAALLKGITFIGDVGHFLLRAGAYGVGRRSSRNDSGAALPIVGLGLLVIGWLGSLSAAFIKSAISRQKEYLADASAVQFTRSNEGIANALKVIGGHVPGTLVHAARAEEMSHIFFGEVTHRIWNAFATHPPLPDRIRRLQPSWDGHFIERQEVRVPEMTASNVEAGIGREALVTAAIAGAALDAATASMAGDAPVSALDAEFSESPRDDTDAAIPEALVSAAHDPLGASALSLALLAGRDTQPRAEVLSIIRQHGVQGQADLVASLLPAVDDLCPGQRFPLMAMAIPALKGMSTPQYRQFKSTLLSVIRADKQTDLFEWCLFQLLRHYLDPEYLRVEPSKPRYRQLEKVRGPLRQVLSVLAHQGSGGADRAFAMACAELDIGELTLQPLEECTISGFSKGVHTLADCFPLLKPRILKAMAVAAADDGDISVAERELITAVAAVMDCPPPPELALN
ncbi:MAG: M48 family metallopeptidase [Pseudomonadota bacterium]